MGIMAVTKFSINMHLLEKRVRPAFMWDGPADVVSVNPSISVIEIAPKKDNIVHLLFYLPEMEELVQKYLTLPKNGKKQVLLGQILGYLCPTELSKSKDWRGVSYSIGMLQGHKLQRYQIYAEKISHDLTNSVLKERISQIREGVRDFPGIYDFAVEVSEVM